MSSTRQLRAALQAGGVYAGGGWLAYSIVDEVGLRAGLPGWLSASVLVLLVAGLPIIVLTAWVQSRAERSSIRGAGDGRDLDPTLHPEFADAPGAPAGSLERIFTWRRTAGAGAVAMALLLFGTTAFMAARHLGVGPFGTLFAQGVLDENEPIVMADFTSARDPALARAVAEALRIDLVQANAIRVLDSRAVQDALQRMQIDPSAGLPAPVALALAEREGLRAVVRGEVNSLGSGFQLLAELVATDGTVIAAFRETARDSTQLIDAVDRMSNRMRARIGESLRTIRSGSPLSRVSTGSLPALRSYSEALEISRTTGDMLRSLELYERAVALDSTFGMAWLGIGTTLANLEVRRDDMRHAFRRAWELRDRMPELERLRAIASYESHVTRDYRAAAEAYRNLLVLDPENVAARNNLAVRLRSMGRDEEAIELLRPVPPERRAATEWVNLFSAQFELGRFDEAAQTLAGMQTHMPQHLSTAGMIIGHETAHGRFERADTLIAATLSRFSGNLAAQLIGNGRGALVAATQGRIAEAVQRSETAVAAAVRFGLDETAFSLKLQTAAAIAHILDDPERASSMLERALAQHDRAAMPPFAQGHLTIALIRAAAGDIRAARLELSEFERVVPAAERADVAEYHVLTRAQVALHAHEPHEALQLLATMPPYAECRICTFPLAGMAHDMLGQTAAAIDAYTRYLATPYLIRSGSDAIWRARILFRLGELHEQRGDRERALHYYGAFAELWRRADQELQPRVETARRRMAALQPQG
jgi:tetratricopeptide (TPR) repeat protein